MACSRFFTGKPPKLITFGSKCFFMMSKRKSEPIDEIVLMSFKSENWKKLYDEFPLRPLIRQALRTNIFMAFHPTVDAKMQKNDNTRHNIAITIRILWSIGFIFASSKQPAHALKKKKEFNEHAIIRFKMSINTYVW